jgi:hypothetical protein
MGGSALQWHPGELQLDVELKVLWTQISKRGKIPIDLLDLTFDLSFPPTLPWSVSLMVSRLPMSAGKCLP